MSVACDICGKPMVQEGKTFTCTCGQWWGHDGGWRCTILKTLWPSQMSDDVMREQYLPAWEAKQDFFDAINLAAGLKTPEEVAASKAGTKRAIEEWHSEHPQPRPWWRRWI